MTNTQQNLDDFMRAPPDDEGSDDHDQPAADTREGIAQLCLDEALTRKGINRLLRGGPLAVVVIVPSMAWMDPIKAEFRKRTRWDRVVLGVRRKSAVGDAEEARACADALSRGGRVLGVSNLAATLPASLLASADLTITVRSPSDRAVRRLIRWVTSQPARSLPTGAATGLDLDVLCGAIREGSSAADCVRRLAAATRAVSIVDASLADVPHVRDISGYGAAGAWARRLVADIDAWRLSGSDPATFSQLDKNVVLIGAPGTGKTTLVRSIAKSAGLPLTVMSMGQLFATSSGYLDGILKAFDEIMSKAIASGGILLWDELDGLPRRDALSDGRNQDFWRPVIGHVLTTLDGAVSGAVGRIVVIGCTNFGDALDPALIRPGRLRPIIVNLPNESDLAAIMRQHLGQDLAGADLTVAARLGRGATGAEAADWVARARRAAADARRPMVVGDLLALVAPADTRPHDVQISAALHEVAHAAAMELLGAGRVVSVSIVPDGVGGGRTDWIETAKGPLTRAGIETRVVAGLAGRAVDELYGGATTGAGGDPASDLGVATGMIAAVHAAMGLGDDLVMLAPSRDVTGLLAHDRDLARKVDADLKRLHAVAADLVKRHRDLIVAIARRLVEVRVMDGHEFRRLLIEPPASPARPTRGARRHGR